MPLRHLVVDTVLGDVTLVADGPPDLPQEALVALLFDGQRHAPPAERLGSPAAAEDAPLLRRAARELDEYLAGERRDFEVPIATRGDAFHESVWAHLRTIPYGTTVSYGDIAEALGDLRLSQRVGQAVGRNPIGVIVPCHRVIGRDGTLTGYAGGLDRKRRLLALEEPPAADAGRLF